MFQRYTYGYLPMTGTPFFGRRWLMFPPSHDNLDHRVNRTINAILTAGHDLTVYYEADRLVSTGAAQSFAHRAAIERMPGISRAYFLTIFQEIRRNKAEHERLTIYVHDGGFIGLLICLIASMLKRRGDRIIFDYHDFLEWELHYQSGKFVKNTALRRVLVTIVRYFFKFVLRFVIRIDVMVGISDRQIVQLSDRFGISNCTKLAIPNTSEQLKGDLKRNGPPAILWVGNVSKGRRFDWAYGLQQKVAEAPHNLPARIVVVGKRLNKAADDIVDDSVVVELGGFKTDADIARLTQDWSTVGVFFGWDDVLNTGINAISSVNKVYSYINTLSPFLIPANQSSMIASLCIPSEFIFESDDDMASKFVWIADNYEAAQRIVVRIKAGASWDADVVAMLEKEFSR